MAIRLHRVLIACGLPTILAIVSFYWLKRRRKAVFHNPDHITAQETIEADNPIEAEIDLTFHCSSFGGLEANQSDCYYRLNTEYKMQLKDNGTVDACSHRTGSEELNSNVSIRSDDSSATNRQMHCKTGGNECKATDNEFHCKYSNLNDDKIVVKLSNITINEDNKDIQRKGEDINVIIGERDSKCDNSCEGVDRNGSQTQTNDNNNEFNECKVISLTDGTGSHRIVSHALGSEKSIDCNVGVNCGNGDVMAMSETALDVTSSACSSSASCPLANGYENGDVYHNYPDSVDNGMGHSPPHSFLSDNHSEGSSDSGKGGSDILHAPTGDVDNKIAEIVVYQFEIPQYLCGRLIGHGGHFVSSIKRMTDTSIVINRHFHSTHNKICTLTGTRPAIKDALNHIRNRFPSDQFAGLTLQQINLINGTQTYPVPQTCQLQLPSGISCDVILSSLVSAGHFFLQQPTHPTYPSLSRLDHIMSQTYSQQNTPLLPNIHTGMVCAVPVMGGWYRAVINKVYDTEECDVMFVDYGGYSRLPVSCLRQIRYDFMSLPFQSSECHLANVRPIDPQTGWTAEANALFEELAQGQILQAFIVGYSETGVPFVHLFKIQGISNVFINEELVNRSHAQWIDTSSSS